MLTDTQIIQRAAGYEVMASHQVVDLPDGSSMKLHHVQFCGHVDRFLRGFEADPDHWLVVDVRSLLHRGFEGEVKCAPARDADGLLHFTLRASFPSSESVRIAALRHCRAAWFVPSQLAA